VLSFGQHRTFDIPCFYSHFAFFYAEHILQIRQKQNWGTFWGGKSYTFSRNGTRLFGYLLGENDTSPNLFTDLLNRYRLL